MTKESKAPILSTLSVISIVKIWVEISFLWFKMVFIAHPVHNEASDYISSQVTYNIILRWIELIFIL